MGRRNINATKSGKYINPTDQARKEARKRELRKNKKQRQFVRTSVIKSKDPTQIIIDLERLDQMEYNVYTPPPLNEKVLKDKRRKLKDTWDRICRYYLKEDKEKYNELKKTEREYEEKRNKLMRYYEAVKSTQEVSLDEIPLPSAPIDAPSSISTIATQDIPRPPDISYVPGAPPSILALRTPLGNLLKTSKKPPGVPPGIPPAISEPEDDGSDTEVEGKQQKKIRFTDEQPLDKDKEAEVDEFLKEIEKVEKAAKSAAEPTDSSQIAPPISNPIETPSQMGAAIPPPPSYPNQGIPAQAQGAMPWNRPSASESGFAPPRPHVPPPPGVQPQVPLMMPPRPPGMALGRPPMPPLRPISSASAPPGSRPFPPAHHRMGAPGFNMHAPGLRPPKPSEKKSEGPTIEAKPQLRNLSADSTRFVPVALRIKRDDKPPEKKQMAKGISAGRMSYGLASSSAMPPTASAQAQGNMSKDEAYELFMKELKDIGGLDV